MKSIILIAFILTFLAAFKPNLSLTNNNKLSCTLTSDKRVYKVGELPRFNVEIVNKSKKDFYLIGSLDGSDVKWRFPYCYYAIDKPKPDKIKSSRCGNTNTLRPKDFKLVRAGQKFNPYENIDSYGFFEDHTTTNLGTFKNPGIYKIKFHYSTDSQNLNDFMGDTPFLKNESDSVIINMYFKKVPKVEIISNEIEIRIDE